MNNTARNSARPNDRRGRFQRVPIRSRIGLALRPGMNYGELPDAEQVLAAAGLSLAPMSCGATDTINGMTVLPTADVGDLERRSVSALVLPAGGPDGAGDATLDKLIVTAREQGLPVIAFGDGVDRAARALGVEAPQFDGALAAVIGGGEMTPVASREQLALVASTIG